MKKAYVLVPVLFVLIYACGGQANSENKNSKVQSVTAVETKPEHVGKAAAIRLGCNACHADKRKIVGPSYTDIAKKYDYTDKNHQYLTDRIIKGGSGVWGDIPMTAYPHLSDTELNDVVDYIFTLKN